MLTNSVSAPGAFGFPRTENFLPMNPFSEPSLDVLVFQLFPSPRAILVSVVVSFVEVLLENCVDCPSPLLVGLGFLEHHWNKYFQGPPREDETW